MHACARLLLLAVLPVFVGRGAGGDVLAAGGDVLAAGGDVLAAGGDVLAAGGDVLAAGGDVLAAGEAGPARAPGAGAGPQFAPRQQTAVRAARGRAAALRCRVLHQGDKAVSWVRSRDLQILSHAGAVFTADARVTVPGAAPAGAGDVRGWRSHALRIDRVRDEDAGRYECQLNTEPKMSLFFDLVVTDEAETETEAATEAVEAAGGWVRAAAGEVRGAAGGEAELACAAGRGGAGAAGGPPLDVRWLRAGRPLELQEGWSVWRESGAAQAVSRLRLVRLRAADGGRYTCAAAGRADSVQLVVDDRGKGELEGMQGELEGMQRDQWAGAGGGAGGASSAAGGGLALALVLLTLG